MPIVPGHQAKFDGLVCVVKLLSGLMTTPLDVGVSDWLIVVPFICHSASAPLSLRQRMSAFPSPLKSATSTMCQVASGVTVTPFKVTKLLAEIVLPFISHTAS